MNRATTPSPRTTTSVMLNRVRSTIIIVVVVACGAPPPAGPPIRLSIGPSDTIVVNNSGPTPLPVHALDAAGHKLEAPVRYSRTGGDSLPVSASGTVHCTRRGELTVRAAVEELAAHLTVRCRPVAYVQIPGPVQFILGDSAMSRPRALPVEAHDAYGRLVTMIGGTAGVRDTSIAALEGLTLSPRVRGITSAGVHVGDHGAGIGVHIYQRVDSLSSLDTLLRVPPHQRLFAVPLRLRPGEFERRQLPAGQWMLAMLPESDSAEGGVRLRIERASCRSRLLNTPRRFGCRSSGDAAVVLYRPFAQADTSPSQGYLLVRWMF